MYNISLVFMRVSSICLTNIKLNLTTICLRNTYILIIVRTLFRGGRCGGGTKVESFKKEKLINCVTSYNITKIFKGAYILSHDCDV